MASGIYNLESQRFQKASLDTREEGWTETWGIEQNGTSNEESTSCGENVGLGHGIEIKIDDECISELLSTPHPQLEITLTQHRPAWFEQMLMRVAGIPHIVLNSNHISNEATGQLPYLRYCERSKPPILVGRNQRSYRKNSGSVSNNSILEYLQDYRNVDLDKQAGLTTDKQRGLSRCFRYIVDLELSKILSYLRFEDLDVWEQVYREQYVRASNVEVNREIGLGSINRNNWFMQLRGRLQGSMERAVERKRLFGNGEDRQETIDNLLERASEAYFAIDCQLLSLIEKQDGKHCNHNYLLGTARPALVDVLLWAHLAEAICDAHLVVILASYPRLVTYFQNMYRTYFSTIDENSDTMCAWTSWNEEQNLANAFQKIPTLSKSTMNQCEIFKDAFDFMQKSSLHNQDLQDFLEAVKVMRAEECQPKSRKPTSYLLYRWCMGDTFKQNHEKAKEQQGNSQRQKLLREQARNDQMWISGIVGVSAIALILIQAGN